MLKYSGLNVAQQEEKQEAFFGFTAEIEGLSDGKLEPDRIYGSRNALPHRKKFPRFHVFQTNLAEITGVLLKSLRIGYLEPPQGVVQFLKHCVTDCQDLLAEVSNACHTGPNQFMTIGDKVRQARQARQAHGNFNSKPTNLDLGSINQCPVATHVYRRNVFG
jgi:hypothetical protein